MRRTASLLMLLTFCTTLQAQQALYVCMEPDQPLLSAETEEQRNALTPPCKRWIELRSTNQLTMVLNQLSHKRFEAANDFLAQATKSADYDYPIADNWPVITTKLYSNPERYGFTVVDADKAPAGTIVAYNGLGGILLHGRWSPDQPYTKHVLYPSKANDYRPTLRSRLEIPGKKRPKPLDHFPHFPWPPPKASAIEVLPREYLPRRTTLGGVDVKITAALDSTGYVDTSYHAVRSGFALATRLEQVKSDGTPKAEPNRWSPKVATERFNLVEYLKALFLGKPGYYRVIVFVVSPHAFPQSEKQVTPEQASYWLNSGLNFLPSEMKSLDYTDSYRTTALIYEFAKPTKNDEPSLVSPGTLTGRTHLERSGIWKALDL